MSQNPCCTSAGKVESNYKPKGELTYGKVTKSHDLTIYEAPYDESNKPNKLLICAYDIFGFHPNTKEVCDLLATTADSGFRVILPDFYRGDYWSEERRYLTYTHETLYVHRKICYVIVSFLLLASN